MVEDDKEGLMAKNTKMKFFLLKEYFGSKVFWSEEYPQIP